MEIDLYEYQLGDSTVYDIKVDFDGTFSETKCSIKDGDCMLSLDDLENMFHMIYSAGNKDYEMNIRQHKMGTVGTN